MSSLKKTKDILLGVDHLVAKTTFPENNLLHLPQVFYTPSLEGVVTNTCFVPWSLHCSLELFNIDCLPRVPLMSLVSILWKVLRRHQSLVKGSSQFNHQVSDFQTTRNILSILSNTACEITDIF